MNKKRTLVITLLLTLVMALCSCGVDAVTITPTQEPSVTQTAEPTPIAQAEDSSVISLDDIPDYSEKPYIEINGNEPYFVSSDYTTTSFEEYSELDELGRCGVAYANVGIDIMPTEKREPIGQIKPSGWHTVKYDCISGKYLYNRCHLIGYQLSGENANERNLITGTRYLNIEGMLPFENMVADYVKETENHVLYRVTPMFKNDNLLAHGVLMEAYSVEDNGDGICYNIFCYNSQPSISIDYATGDSHEEAASSESNTSEGAVANTASTKTENYIGNKNTKKFHVPYCSSVDQMNEDNKVSLHCLRDEAIEKGYVPCKRCNP